MPVAEICNGADDDCDGRADDEDDGPLCGAGEACGGGACMDAMTWEWDRTYGSAGFDSVHAVATDSAGNIYAAGEFRGTVDFGSVSRTANGADIFVLSPAANGELGTTSLAVPSAAHSKPG